ncbi:uncharacterized protein LOC100901354 [Galendromus occidentalis]|uniref:Uncharacterized protein LOC100901354 n=1 Tax=Galendromus occidentalis TaxID=34638 RepID=A0AAJ6QUE1_9ACAR|nr:uncharacterized protein LOC100901354 [Galendromus occidentalis]
MAPIEACGLIKQVSALKKIPVGKLGVLTPVHIRGLEVEFTLDHVLVPKAEQRLLEPGMILRFKIKGDSRNGFTADEIKPEECAHYFGSVIRVPTAKDPSSRTIVSLDLTLDPIVISEESLRNLKLDTPLRCGDYVSLAIRWSDWIAAQQVHARPEGEITQVIERRVRRPRTKSQGREAENAALAGLEGNVANGAGFEELSPQHERFARQRDMCDRGSRRRSRSVNLDVGEKAFPIRYYPNYPQCGPQMCSCHCVPVSSDMMYGPFANFFNPATMCMPPPFIPPFMMRGSQ